MTRNKKIIIAGGMVLTIIFIAVFIFLYQFSAPQRNTEEERIVVNLTTTETELIPKLKEQGYIRSEWAFKFALKRKDGMIEAGGYKISKSMSAWKIAKILTSEPYMKWVVIPEGLRKEQIAEILAEELGWNEQERNDWVTKYTAMNWDYVEGVYFPDTYLIPKNETGLEIARRFIDKFNEEFAPYSEKFIEANIKWDTALKIASLVQREAGGKDDMPLIAGIIWSRLLQGMKLEIDATLQYARGNTGNGWWAPITVADKGIDSPYNTYLHSGLPPHPICNPGTDAIDAVLNSAETNCLYYLHDSNRQIHCAETYDEHKENVKRYLLSNDSVELELPMEHIRERVIKKPFGIKISPENSPISPERFSGYHTGNDYEIFENEKDIDVEIFAICSGRLLRKEIISGYGGALVQECKLENQPITVLYGHIQLGSAQQQIGDYIIKSDFLALLGEAFSKDTDGERKHLHLSIHRGVSIDVRGYVQNESELKDWIDFEKYSI